ncbi:hypothetical protein SAMN05444841_10867 [Enterobacter kobei]|nr:hypothetical protein SAMN05444841_10867 [Enterobacter kobei]
MERIVQILVVLVACVAMLATAYDLSFVTDLP